MATAPRPQPDRVELSCRTPRGFGSVYRTFNSRAGSLRRRVESPHTMILAALILSVHPNVPRIVSGSGVIACPEIGVCMGSVDGEMVVRCLKQDEHKIALGRYEF